MNKSLCLGAKNKDSNSCVNPIKEIEGGRVEAKNHFDGNSDNKESVTAKKKAKPEQAARGSEVEKAESKRPLDKTLSNMRNPRNV